MKNQNGFGITEVLIASIFVGLAGVAAMQAADYFARSKVTQKQDEAFLRLNRGLELIFANQSTCDANLAGQVVDPSGILKLSSVGLANPGATDPSVFALPTNTNPNAMFPIGVAANSGAIYVNEIYLEKRGSFPATQKERWELIVNVARPSGPNFVRPLSPIPMRRTYEILIEMENPPNQLTIKKCLVPGSTSIAGGTPPGIQATCLGTLQGEYIAGPPERCDLRRNFCRTLNIPQDPTTKQCDTNALRQATLVGLVGDGPCQGTNTYLKSFGIDGSPICGPALGKAKPHAGIVPAALNCGTCWKDSPVPCYDTAGTPIQRFRIYSNGVLNRTMCGSGGLLGIDQCVATASNGNAPCDPTP